MKGLATFVAGAAVGLTVGYVAFRAGAPAALAPRPVAPPVSFARASPAGTLIPSAALTPPAAIVTPEPPASPWPTPPAGEPLGAPTPPAIPGDSTDAHLDPRAFAPPADLAEVALPGIWDFDRLRARALLLPVDGFDRARLRDNFAERRGARVHEAIDLLAPRGTAVVAVDDGVVKKLFTSGAGGLTVYQYDRGQAYCYYYAHLDRYAEGLAEGKALKKGDRVGYVGTTGNAPPGTPHLHFTILRLGADKRWWEGTPINPYPLWALAR